MDQIIFLITTRLCCQSHYKADQLLNRSKYFNYMDEQLKQLNYSKNDTGSYGVVSAFTAVPSKLTFLISAVMPYVMFYFESAPTLSTNPQDGTLSVTVSMCGVSTNNGKQTWPIWSDVSVTTVDTDML